MRRKILLMIFLMVLGLFGLLDALSIELPASITFVAGETHDDSFGQYITNDTGNDITLTCSGMSNVLVNIHHGTDIEFTSDPTWSGTETITFTVTDGTESASDDIDVIVTPAVSDLSIDLPASITFVAGETHDDSFGQYITNNTGNDITLTCSGMSNVLVNIHHGTDINFTCDSNWSGTETITFTVTDGTESASDDIDIIVTPAASDLSIDLPASITFVAGETHDDSFGQYITNNTGNDITLTCSGMSNVLVNIHHGTDINFTCDSNWSGTETITFTVTDGTESASDDIDVIVTPAASDLSIDLPASITFVAGETHDDSFGQYITNNTGNDITLTCSGMSNVLVNIHHGTDINFTCDSNWSGTETITFTVTDGTESASDDIDIIVTPAVSDLSIDLPASITFVAGETHDDSFGQYITNNTGNDITLTCSGMSNVLVNIHHGTDIEFTSDPTWSGTETITFTVTDGTESASDDIDIIVTPAASDLSIDLPASITFVAGETHDDSFGQYITNNTGNDITLTCSGMSNVLVNIHHGTDIEFTSDSTWSGTETITFTVTDGTESASDDIDIIVTPAASDLSIDLPASITFVAGETHDDSFGQYITNNTGNDITLTCSGMSNVLVNIHHGTDINFTCDSNWSGTETITFTVTDGTESASDDIDIIVTPVDPDLLLELPDSIAFDHFASIDVDFNPYITNNTGNDLTLSYSGNVMTIITLLNNFVVRFEGFGPWIGTETVTFSITDNNGREIATDTVEVTVIPEPGDITISLPDEITMITNTVREEDFSHYITSLFIYDITWEEPEYINVSIDEMQHVFFSVSEPGWVGTENIVFIVTDYFGLVETDSLDVVVLPVSEFSLTLPTTFTMEVNQTVVRELSGFTDEENVIFSVTGNQNVNFNFSGSELTMSSSAGWTGEEAVTITAETSTGVQASDGVTVVVEPLYDNSVIYKGGSYDGFAFAFGSLIEFYTLSGVVVNAENAARIPGAVITIGELETTTNNDGEYEIELEYGTYDISCFAANYDTSTVENFVVEEDDVLNFQLTPTTSSGDILTLTTKLQTNYPNPFNPETTIFYYLEETSDICLEIYNVKGQKVRQLVNDQVGCGQHSIVWDGKDDTGQSLASGIFFYRMTTGKYSSVKKMILIK